MHIDAHTGVTSAPAAAAADVIVVRLVRRGVAIASLLAAEVAVGVVVVAVPARGGSGGAPCAALWLVIAVVFTGGDEI